jgi:hypothetical protein
MNFTFFHRPETRKFNYKPQFYEPTEEKVKRSEEFDSDEFAKRLHKNWSSKRKTEKKGISNFKSIIWIIFILFLLLFFYYKVFMK